MFEAFLRVVDALIPVFVAVVTAYGAVLVAKVSKIQKDIKTNHGSKNLGDAIDTIWNKVDASRERIDDIATTLDAMQSRDESLSRRVYALEQTKHRMLKQLNLPKTGPVVLAKRAWNKRNK